MIAPRTTFALRLPRPSCQTIIDNIGLPYSSLNLSYSNSAPIGAGDADILVELAPGHRPTNDYVRELRVKLNHDFPGTEFYALPTDIVTKILNFGLPAPIDIQILGRDILGDRQFADHLLNELKFVPGTVDLRIQQKFDEPKLHIEMNRTKAEEIGFNALTVAQNVLISLSGSFQTQPTFWLDPQTGVSYNITTQTPEYRTDSLQKLENIPLTSGTNQSDILSSLASFSRSSEMAVVSHYNVEPAIDIYGAVDGRDLGGVARDIQPIIDRSPERSAAGFGGQHTRAD